MKMTTKGQYAIVALTYMRKRAMRGDTAPVRLQEISESEKISLHYLEQLFRLLRMSRIVRSIRGPGGGYVLGEGAISYKRVLESVGEKISFRDSITDKSEASNDVVENLNDIYEKTTNAFEAITI